MPGDPPPTGGRQGIRTVIIWSL